MILSYICQTIIAVIFSGECNSQRQWTDTTSLSQSWPEICPVEVNSFSNRSIHSQYSPSPIVVTRCGTFEGYSHVDENGVEYEEFLGIRYAEPPLGPLRFKNPMPFKGYAKDMLYRATEFCPPCMQSKKDALETSGMLPSEDCLCLNIYRPSECNEGTKKPVLVYILESKFYQGSASQFEIKGGYLGNFGDMIVVTMNYRLGPLGWLYSGNDEVTGNMGYHDIVLVVEWVKQYIEDFGGDPESITVGGHGAGATLANMLLLDLNLPQDLFRAVMVLSPDFNVKTYVDPYWEALRKSRNIADLLGCGDQSNPYGLSRKTIDCLRDTHGTLLGDISARILHEDDLGICARNQFFPLFSPEQGSWDYRLDNSLYFTGKPVYTGWVSTESLRSLQGMVAENKDAGEQFLRRHITNIISDKSSNNVQAIIDWYMRRVVPSDIHGFRFWARQGLDDLCHGCVAERLIQRLKRTNPVFVYRYLYVSSCDRDSNQRKHGPIHGDDILLNFGAPFMKYHKYSDYDRAVSMEMISIWSDFIHGRPMNWLPRSPRSNPVAYLYGDARANYAREDPSYRVCMRMDA